MPQALPKIQDWFESREDLRGQFLRRLGIRDDALSPVGEDCAFRRYFRARQPDGRTAILMEAVPDGAAFATPGHNIHDFVRIDDYLRARGLNAPRIYSQDTENGYLLLEDFGSVSFKTALKDGVSREQLYELATDVLRFLRERAVATDINLPRYYDSHVHIARRRLIDWYMPVLRQQRVADGIAGEYLDAWDRIEQSLPPVPQGFLHIDYHFENLMWLPEREGLMRCGILDFQGAMAGPLPYDLANLLEDARVDVPQDLREAMLARFCQGMTEKEESVFRSWYRVLATQFHCRVLGQFIRLAVKDGKDRYLQHLPRLAGYIREGLRDPVLLPLKEWLESQDMDFSSVPEIDIDRIRPLMRPDAF